MHYEFTLDELLYPSLLSYGSFCDYITGTVHFELDQDLDRDFILTHIFKYLRGHIETELEGYQDGKHNPPFWKEVLLNAPRLKNPTFSYKELYSEGDVRRMMYQTVAKGGLAHNFVLLDFDLKDFKYGHTYCNSCGLKAKMSVDKFCAKCGTSLYRSTPPPPNLHLNQGKRLDRPDEFQLFDSVPYEVRDKHIYIAGKTRHGKSTLLHHLAKADILNGHGVCVIDPAGDLTQSLLEYIPERRVKDTIYLSLDTPVPIDIFAHDPDERSLLVSDLMGTFKRLSELTGGTWGTRFASILRDILYTLLEANDVEDPSFKR